MILKPFMVYYNFSFNSFEFKSGVRRTGRLSQDIPKLGRGPLRTRAPKSGRHVDPWSYSIGMFYQIKGYLVWALPCDVKVIPCHARFITLGLFKLRKILDFYKSYFPICVFFGTWKSWISGYYTFVYDKFNKIRGFSEFSKFFDFKDFINISIFVHLWLNSCG